MSKFILKYQDTEWDIDNPSLTITHEFVSSGIDVVLEHIENFLRSAGYAVDGKLEFVSVEDDSNEYEDIKVYSGSYDDSQGAGNHSIVDDLNINWPYDDVIKIDPVGSFDNMNSSSTYKNDEITIKVEDSNDQPIHFRV